jgi:S-adenosylmethionine/arginine decarboxylase-like enzyme
MTKESIVSALRGESPKKGETNSSSVVKALNTTKSPEPAITLSDKENPPTKGKSWGFHLLIDCSEMNEKINSPKAIEEFFDNVIKALKMKKLTEFFYKKVSGEEGRGVSAFQMITTSHISMHFDDNKRSGYLDIFSCKKFDPDIVIKMIDKYFEPKDMASQLIYRDAGLIKGKK